VHKTNNQALREACDQFEIDLTSQDEEIEILKAKIEDYKSKVEDYKTENEYYDELMGSATDVITDLQDELKETKERLAHASACASFMFDAACNIAENIVE
jgi:chromosome segregation ATPase